MGTSFFAFCRGIIHQTWRSLARTPGTQLLTLFTVMLSVLIFAFFLLIHLNLLTLGSRLGNDFRLTVHLSEEIPTPLQPKIEEQIRQYGGIGEVRFLSRREVFERFAARLGDEDDILSDLGSDFLPPAIEVIPRSGVFNPGDFEQLAAYLITLPAAEKLQYGKKWLQRFNGFNRLLRVVVVVSAGLLVLNMIFIISHTVRLTVAARREELETLHLLGADRTYISAPFLAEGLLQGGVGSLLGLAALFLLYRRAAELFGESGLFTIFTPSFLTLPVLITLIAAGAVLCTLSSLVTINKALRN